MPLLMSFQSIAISARKSLVKKIFWHTVRYFTGLLDYTRHYAISSFSLIKDYYSDKKLNIQTDETYHFQDNSSLFKDGQIYQPTPYYMLEKIVDYLKPKPEDILVDFGSGKGRVVFFMALQRLKKVTGLELNRELIDIAQKNLNSFSLSHSPIEFVNADASTFRIQDESIFFMFNPFGSKTIGKVIDNIKHSLITNPRQVQIVYYSPAYRNLLYSQDWLSLRKDIDNGGCLIWHNKS